MYFQSILVILTIFSCSTTLSTTVENQIKTSDVELASTKASSNTIISVKISPVKASIAQISEVARPHPFPSFKPTTTKPVTSRPSMKPSLRTTVAPTLKKLSSYPSPKSSITVPTSLSEDISYHGGAIMTGKVNAYNIYYGDISSATKNLVNYFVANLGNSSWYSAVTPYYQIVNGVKTMVSKSLVLKNSVDVAATKTILRVNDVAMIIINLFNAGKLPADINGVYSFFFRGDITATFDFPSSSLYWLQDFCGYHGAFYLGNNGETIKFMVIGDPSYAGVSGQTCEAITDPSGTANNNLGADSMVSIYAHVIANTITDYNGNQWYFDSNGLESADACDWKFGDYAGNSNVVVGNKRFLVQQMWVPTKGCVMSL